MVVYTFKTGISPAPTSRRVRQELIALLPGNVEGTIYELGSGWGGMAFALAKKYPSSQVVGYELSPLPYLISLCRKWISRQRNLKLYRRNFYKQPLNGGLYICYLYPGGMRKLDKILPKDAFVVSHTFALERKANYIYEATDPHRTKIYYY